ncbi:MAG: L-histidine N(alpha)-methyltransferase [Acidobacteriota bacterium]|nr:L-histidine N(alpha)-methyltransferase [Acidobacteriota bacterium]
MPIATLPTLNEAVLSETLTGLCAFPKTLPPWLFYDERGSQLFEQITALPEYYLTRAERSILAENAAWLPPYLAAPVTVAELGAGTATKTGILLRQFVECNGEALYQPIDISPTALDEAAASLAAVVPGVTVRPQVANYLTDPYDIERPERHKILALYIGSSIGNFSPREATGILRKLRGHLRPGDSLLLGADVAPGNGKTVEALLAAYDDAAGVTAEFNRNVLVRLNRELAAGFDVDAFAHRVRWNARASRIEMHLESLIGQTVYIAGEKIVFAGGETIHTENSYKFTAASVAALLAGSGFAVDRTLYDRAHFFAVTLAKAV